MQTRTKDRKNRLPPENRSSLLSLSETMTLFNRCQEAGQGCEISALLQALREQTSARQEWAAGGYLWISMIWIAWVPLLLFRVFRHSSMPLLVGTLIIFIAIWTRIIVCLMRYKRAKEENRLIENRTADLIADFSGPESIPATIEERDVLDLERLSIGRPKVRRVAALWRDVAKHRAE